MTHDLLCISALAYTTLDVASQISCTFRVRYRRDHSHATISLRTSTSIHGFDDEQTFTLLYDADNLVPGTTLLKPATVSLQQAQLARIARQGNPQLTTLSLNLKKPCSIWCPACPGSIAPKNGFDTPFHQLVSLVRATEVHILFDLKWLHRDKWELFHSLFRQPEKYTGFLIDYNNAKGCRLADWTVFSPIEDPSLETLPTYTEASKKRARQASTSSIRSPPSKRALLPAPVFTNSPTEKATTASTPSPKLPPSFIVDTSDIQDAFEETVKKLLPSALAKILPDMLTRLLAGPQASLSLSPASSFSSSKPPRTPKPISSLGTLITSQVAAQVQSQLQNIYTETLDHAHALRNTADDEFLDAVQDHRLDVLMTKDDSIAELHRDIDSIVTELKQSTADIVEEAGEQAEKVCRDVCARLDKLVEEKKARLEPHAHDEKMLQDADWSTVGPVRQRPRAASLP